MNCAREIARRAAALVLLIFAWCRPRGQSSGVQWMFTSESSAPPVDVPAPRRQTAESGARPRGHQPGVLLDAGKHQLMRHELRRVRLDGP